MNDFHLVAKHSYLAQNCVFSTKDNKASIAKPTISNRSIKNFWNGKKINADKNYYFLSNK